MHAPSICATQPRGNPCWLAGQPALVSFCGQMTMTASSSIDSPANCPKMNYQPHLQPITGEHNRLFEFELWAFFRLEAFQHFSSISSFAFKTQLVLRFVWYSINCHKVKPVLTSVWQIVLSWWRIPWVWRLTHCWLYWLWLGWSYPSLQQPVGCCALDLWLKQCW